MHHVLKPTELRRLRELGFEVFCPAYLSPLFDQSADLSVDRQQYTTLPSEVFDALLAHNFFYTSIPPDIADILNTYFDVVIVTIHADWLASFLSVFRGRIIYRVYGQPWSLSEQMINNGVWRDLIDRSDFYIVPFASESVESEQPWFLERCSHVVPYQIANDVFDYTRTWGEGRRRQEIAVNIPNIQDPYYARIYQEFNVFDERYFRILGPQRDIPPDPRVLGKMDRPVFLKRLGESAGYFYPYRDNVCYLPPIEMMEVGGPVLYLTGSLLARFGDPSSPALAADTDDAKRKLGRLLKGDKAFIDDVLAAQEPIRRRYDRNCVRPVFDKAFLELLGGSDIAAESMPRIKTCGTTQGDVIGRNTIVVPLHHDGLFSYVNGRPAAFEGIPRVVDVVVDTIIATSDARVLLSCLPGSEPVMRDFFAKHIRAGRLDIHVVKFAGADTDRNTARLALVDLINKSGDNIRAVFIPHYYLFPECLLLSAPSIMYLPDYFPHLMPVLVFDVSREKDRLNKRVGVGLAKRAKRILTNSQYTKDYLTDAGFVAQSELDKVVVAPLPLLGHSRSQPLTSWEQNDLRRHIGEGPFLFYPTANRPNKNLSFLARLFAHMRLSFPTLHLVLTCDLNSVPTVREAVETYGVAGGIVLLPGSSDSRLRWLYENAAALCLTSTAEGNFPPQILEAIRYQAPVVTTRLPTIVEVAGPEIGRLLTCDALNLAQFADALLTAFESREAVLKDQAVLAEKMKSWNSAEAFAARIKLLFDEDASVPAEAHAS